MHDGGRRISNGCASASSAGWICIRARDGCWWKARGLRGLRPGLGASLGWCLMSSGVCLGAQATTRPIPAITSALECHRRPTLAVGLRPHRKGPPDARSSGRRQHHGWSVLTETEPSSRMRTFTYTSGGGIRSIDAPAGRMSQLVIEPQTVL